MPAVDFLVEGLPTRLLVFYTPNQTTEGKERNGRERRRRRRRRKEKGAEEGLEAQCTSKKIAIKYLGNGYL